MKNILTIVGARPQIIKAAALSRAIKTHFMGRINEILVHTGQHYDTNMSQVFFDEMGIPQPDINLGVGSKSHGLQTAAMIERIEEILLKQKPDFVVLYGDTNSTLAGAIAASKVHVPVVHIEAGLRSFNKSMPEEINRIVCDHTSSLLFTPTLAGLNNLAREGFNLYNIPPYSSDNPGIFHCGDVMFDNSLYFADVAETKSDVMYRHKLTRGNFILATIHRDNNTDVPGRLNALFEAMDSLSREYRTEIILPLHPRTSKLLKQNLKTEVYRSVESNPFLKIIPPVSFFEMLTLEKNCSLVMTDSGGVQKEAYFFRKPVIILRPETEWVEIVENGCGLISDANKERIIRDYVHFRKTTDLKFHPIFGNGKAAEFICSKIADA
jgi:UDP-GlcNAc3NAcA epimerase